MQVGDGWNRFDPGLNFTDRVANSIQGLRLAAAGLMNQTNHLTSAHGDEGPLPRRWPWKALWPDVGQRPQSGCINDYVDEGQHRL